MLSIWVLDIREFKMTIFLIALAIAIDIFGCGVIMALDWSISEDPFAILLWPIIAPFGIAWWCGTIVGVWIGHKCFGKGKDNV